jgi:hypothetical protein
LLDAARLRRRGIDTIAIVWEGFEKAARAQAKLHGVRDLPIFVVPQLAPGEDDENQRDKARNCIDELVTCWSTVRGQG